jgi:hypothetical protein
MSTVQEIRDAILKLPLKDQVELRDSLDDLVEDETPVSDAFKASIERGMKDIEEGRVRIRQGQA